MTFRNVLHRDWRTALLVSAFLISSAMAQDYGRRPPLEPNRYGGYPAPARPRGPWGRWRSAGPPLPVYRLADRSPSAANPPRPVDLTRAPDEHPLMPAIRWAREGIEHIRRIQDYSAIMVKRERVGGKMCDEEYMFVKVRHQPMSVYMYFLKPQTLQGQEVIWIEGENDGKMWAHGTGMLKVFGARRISPTSAIAMRGNRYPITEIGILNLVERLLEVAENDAQYGECEVKFIRGAKINNRVCTCIQVMHPVPRRNFLFHLARIFVDDELNLPIRYEAYEWPREPGDPPVPIEQYTYLNLKLNNGFTDRDFDIYNQEYGFKPRGRRENR